MNLHIDKIRRTIYSYLTFLKVERRVVLDERITRIAKTYNNLLHSKKFKQIAGKRLGLALLVFSFTTL